MNLLFLGGTGFLGSHCARALAKKHNIIILDIRDNYPDLYAKYYKTALSDVQKIKEIIDSEKIDIVFHCVSTLLPSSSFEDYQNDLMVNYLPSIKLFSYCADSGIKLVYISSGGAVYGTHNEIFNENTKREPISYYGLSKLNFENIIHFLHQNKKLDYMILRPSNPYGPGQNINGKQGVIAVLIGKILDFAPFEIWGDGTAIKDYIYIDDFSDYVEKLIEIESWNCDFNIGSGIGNSVNDVINCFKENKISLPEIIFLNSKTSDVKRMILDCSKIQELFPEKKCLTLSEGIKKFFKYESEK